ncbi:isochorismatase family protein [Alphaproteobacteria bacterium]|nr:isochorismatase family protein [Alphaproteobacteria bacterium]
MPTKDEVKQALEILFQANTEIYLERGFQRKLGYGNNPAILNIDLANAWTKPGHAFSCNDMDIIIPNVKKINSIARTKDIPIIYTTTAFTVTKDKNTDMGLWHKKIPIEVLNSSSAEDVSIDERIYPKNGDHLILKKRASAFHGTHLSSFLNANRIDTLIITGVTVAGCVRHTVEDAIAEGFRPIVVEEAVGDRVPGAIAWNLFDINSKFGDVESIDSVLNYLNSL